MDALLGFLIGLGLLAAMGLAVYGSIWLCEHYAQCDECGKRPTDSCSCRDSDHV